MLTLFSITDQYGSRVADGIKHLGTLPLMTAAESLLTPELISFLIKAACFLAPFLSASQLTDVLQYP